MVKKYKLNIRRFIIFFVGFTLVILSAWSFSKGKLPSNSTETKEIKKSVSISTESIEKKLQEETEQVLRENFSNEELENLSIAYTMVDSKKTKAEKIEVNYNAEKMYVSASTIKVPIALYLYDLAESNPAILEETLSISNEDYEGGTGILQGFNMGTSFSVRELLAYMIIYSDNIATNRLLRGYFEEPSNLAQELTPYFGTADYENHESSAINRMEALRYLYENRERYKTLLESMENSQYKDYIPKYLPDTCIVENKIGTMGDTIHDYGIVETSDFTYLISISMEGIDNEGERMALLSKSLYDLIESVVS